MNHLQFLSLIAIMSVLFIHPNVLPSFSQTPVQSGPTINDDYKNPLPFTKQSIPSIISDMKAPAFVLPSSLGGNISLSDYAGKKNVLLYFQEG